MEPEDLKRRAKAFALQAMDLVDRLPVNRATDVIARQFLRSATGTGANYRAACRARSKPDFIYKVGNAEEEADESAYWLELLVEGRRAPQADAADLLREANELTAIFTASGRTAKRNR